MKTIICFVLIVITVSTAKDGNVYVYNSRDYYSDKPRAKPKPRSVFTFGYYSRDMLSMHIYLTNSSPNVSAGVNLSYLSGLTIKKKKLSRNKGEKQFQINRLLQYSKIFIEVELTTTDGLYSTNYNIIIATIMTRDNTNNMLYNDVCLKEKPCVIEVDLSCSNYICEVPFKPNGPKSTDRTLPQENIETPTNKSNINDTDSNDQQKLKSVLIYPTLSVIGISVVILVIYISVKKYCHRNSRPVETTELNTYATANEVVYADLSLVHADSQPSRRDEELTYAKIIGVMKPVPR